MRERRPQCDRGGGITPLPREPAEPESRGVALRAGGIHLGLIEALCAVRPSLFDRARGEAEPRQRTAEVGRVARQQLAEPARGARPIAAVHEDVADDVQRGRRGGVGGVRGGEPRERVGRSRIAEPHQHTSAAVDGERPEGGVARGGAVGELRVAQAIRLHQHLAIEHERGGARIALGHGALDFDAGGGRVAVQPQRAREGDTLRGEFGRQARAGQRDAGGRVVRFRSPGHEVVQNPPGTRGVAEQQRQARGVERLAGQRQRVEGGR